MCFVAKRNVHEINSESLQGLSGLSRFLLRNQESDNSQTSGENQWLLYN